MKTVVQNDKYGKIVFKESFFGKETLIINNEPLVQISDNHFRYAHKKNAPDVVVKGNILTGVTLRINSDVVQLVPKPSWYVTLISTIATVLLVVVGDFSLTGAIFPIEGGFLGVLINLICSLICIYVTSKEKNPMDKILFALCFLAAAVLLCHLAAVFTNMIIKAF